MRWRHFHVNCDALKFRTSLMHSYASRAQSDQIETHTYTHICWRLITFLPCTLLFYKINLSLIYAKPLSMPAQCKFFYHRRVCMRAKLKLVSQKNFKVRRIRLWAMCVYIYMRDTLKSTLWVHVVDDDDEMHTSAIIVSQ